jgi:hypothetical protein
MMMAIIRAHIKAVIASPSAVFRESKAADEK